MPKITVRRGNLDKLFKVCTKCKKELHICCFYKDSSKKDGLRSSCCDCKAKTDREYTLKNKKKVLLKKAEYRNSHREELKKQNNIRYHSLDKNAENKRRLQHNKDNPKKRQEVVAVSFSNKRAKDFKIEGKLTVEQWRDIKRKFFYKCLCCGKQEPDIDLTIDHIVPLIKGGLNTSINIQPLCGYCNKSKGDKEISYA